MIWLAMMIGRLVVRRVTAAGFASVAIQRLGMSLSLAIFRVWEDCREGVSAARGRPWSTSWDAASRRIESFVT